ncbi:MAG TPA: alpha/beta hydrolase [Candidatus Kryptonia bacterium]|nr:alpha/beta hydrolase [Candidatus Kryptonia bacterium]
MNQKPREVMSDGVRLCVEVLGKGTPLLFAHSLGSCRHQVRRLLEPLVREFQIIVFDQRGHCGSAPVTDPALYNPQSMAKDIAAVLDAVGIEQAIIGGESMGAATALLFATQQPKRVRHLLQVAPTVADEPNPGGDMVTALADFAAQYGLTAAADAVALAAMGRGIPRSAAQMITAHWTHHQLDSFVAANRAVPQWVLFDSLAPVAALRMPIGVVGWGGDPSRPISLARRLASAARNGHLETVESLGEMASDPGLYAQLIRRLLDR